MKLDFSKLSRPVQNHGGRVGHGGHVELPPFPTSPEASPYAYRKGDKCHDTTAVWDVCPPTSHHQNANGGQKNSCICADVPPVPLVPPENDDGDFEERAAIMEFDGGLSRQEAERLARQDLNGDNHG